MSNYPPTCVGLNISKYVIKEIDDDNNTLYNTSKSKYRYVPI